MRTLTARLVLTAVALLAVVTLLMGTATALVMRSYLTDQLDDKVTSSVRRAGDGPRDGVGPGGPRGGPEGFGNQEPGTLVALIEPGATIGSGEVVGEQFGEMLELTTEHLVQLSQVPIDGDAHTLRLDELGRYRVIATSGPDGDTLVTGLPTADLDEAIGSLVGLEILLGLLGVASAGGAGFFVVRRQLRPLTEVAETAHAVAALPLASGEVGVTERVPEHLTDERTEVGRVGAALNTLLAHVETSLDAREQSEQRVRQFVADASHELRTPLTTIAGYTELARSRPDDTAAATTALDKVAEESTRMTALVEDLLLLARLDAGRPLEREPVDLTRLALEAIEDARVVAPDHRWSLNLPEQAVEVTGDAHRLHQVLTNLLTNARKHTPARTQVTVTVHRDGFDITDTGPGFPPELVDHAFERFARGDAARHREGGVGLGLALVQAIVTAHGGTVRLTSSPGNTQVSVRLGQLT